MGGRRLRKAHALVGSLVAEAQATGASLRATAARLLPGHAPDVAAQLDALFDPAQAVAAKAVRGGTAPAAVRVSLEAARALARSLHP